MWTQLDFAGEIVIRLIRWMACLTLAIMAALTFIDVLGRYLLNKPVFGAAEMIQFLLAGTVFAGLVLVSRQDGHVAVELISPRIEEHLPVIHRIIVNFASSVGLFLIFFEMLRLTEHAFKLDRVSIVLEWHYGFVLVPATVLSLLAAIVQVRQAKAADAPKEPLA